MRYEIFTKKVGLLTFGHAENLEDSNFILALSDMVHYTVKPQLPFYVCHCKS